MVLWRMDEERVSRRWLRQRARRGRGDGGTRCGAHGGMSHVEHIAAATFHGRRGAVENAFTYSIDYVLVDAEDPRPRAPWLFGRNRAGLTSLH
ncbi:DUF1365 family protein, partial [Roseicyclus sp.]|uniref:DUF1365 family protein n=1 Tax=Roseicyclus sp. TaxID=1914329 RepID=UPI0040545C9F